MGMCPIIPKPERNRHFSDLLDFRNFERENRRRLYKGFAFAAAMLALLDAHWHPAFREAREAAQTPYRTIIIDIIEIPSRDYSEPFMIGKPKAFRAFRRPITGMSLPLGKIGTKPAPLPGKDALPKTETEGVSLPAAADSLCQQTFFPPKPEYKTGIARLPENHFSLDEEGMNPVDIDSLGIYKGFIIQDPADKRRVKGFFYIPRAIREIPASKYNLDATLLGLAEAVNHFTNIEEKVELPITLSSPDLMRYPILYLASADNSAFEMRPSCIRNLNEYLYKGGFLIVDNGCPWYEFSPAKASLLNILLQAAGKDARFEPIPADHPIFYCFFDISAKLPDGDSHTAPPMKEKPDDWGRLLHIPELEDLRQRISTRRENLWGLWYGERLAAVYLEKGYGHTWRDGFYAYKYRNHRLTLELGVNIAVFALIQKGGIAQKYVDYTAEGIVSPSKNDKKEK